MTIGRTQISKQIDGKLGDPKNTKKQKKKLQVKKSNKKNPLARTFTVQTKSDTIKTIVQQKKA